jgi:hypothetical protein
MTKRIRWSAYWRRRFTETTSIIGSDSPPAVAKRRRLIFIGWCLASNAEECRAVALQKARAMSFNPHPDAIEVHPWPSDPHRNGRQAMQRRGAWPFRR